MLISFSAVRRKVKSRPVLKSLSILSQRSAMPALSARAKPASSASTERVHKQPKLSAADKERLLRIARKGAVRALDGMGMGSASLATKGVEAADLKDVWGQDGMAVEDEVAPPDPEAWGYEARLNEVKPHAPVTYSRQRQLQTTLSTEKALPIPDSGISYNPKLEAYQALLDAAVQQEMDRLERERQQEARIEKFRLVAKMNAIPTERGVAPGMTVAAGDTEALATEALSVDSSAGPEVFAQLLKIKATTRKTQADRNRIARRRAADQKIAEARAAKKLRAHLASLPSLKAQAEARVKAAAEAEERKKQRERELAQRGMVPGSRMGKHFVQGRDVEVQLGEDLSENLRELKVRLLVLPCVVCAHPL
jgi:nucleolar protein 53